MATAPNIGIFNNSETTFRYDPMARVDILSAKGYALLCNGLDPNTKWDPENGQSDLFMRGPQNEIIPAITFAPSSEGKIFGSGYKWRYRFVNSKTGETSGMSPLPVVGLNLGTVTSGSSFMGQTAYMRFEGVDTAGVDTFEILRNTSGQDDVFYVIDKTTNPGSGSYISFTDNRSDDEIWNNEQAALRPNPSYFEPHPPPCARLFQHATGRVWLYGRRPTGTYTRGTIQTIVGLPIFGGPIFQATGPTVTGSGTGWHRGLEGQALRLDTDLSKTIFRIIEVNSTTSLNVSPIPSRDTTLNGTYQILDDIDTRNIYMTQPSSPIQFDPLDVITIGQDRSDNLTGVFAWQGETYALTRRRLYRLSDDISEDPVGTVRINKVADVGCVGLWAWTETPFGVVFVSEKLGVTLFDGMNVMPLGSPTMWHDFLPKTQFEGFDEGLLFDCLVYWSPKNRRITVSYCPEGTMLQVEQLEFDPTTKTWRGPWRRPMHSAGTLIDSLGEDVELVGDQFGGLYKVGDSSNDVVDSPTSGTVASVESKIAVTMSGTPLFTDSMVGASIVFDDGAGNYYTNWIARVATTSQIILMYHPTVDIAADWTFIVGGINWIARTGYLDLGEPMLPKHLHHIGVRYETMVTNVDNLVVEGTSEGRAFTAAADTASETEVQGLIKGDANLHIGGMAFQLRLSGRASYGGPRVTRLIANMVVNQGTADGKEGDTGKVVITPTAS